MKNRQPLRLMTAEGELRGRMDDDLFVFRGIPFAAAPVGALRWRAPQPVAPWQGVRDAVDFGAASWQNRELCKIAGGGDPGPLSEDCLYLNVWTPDIEPSKPLPVMVWLHGGGFAMGSGALPPYSGKPLAARGAVVVTVNYRLGHLGFFAHPALDAEYRDGDVVNNFALLDQIAALQWVQRNIPAFGGDRDNVTLFGESSGARSVLSLCCSPLAEGLFHKGIVQSAYSLPDKPRKAALRQGEEVAAHFGLRNATAEQLRALPADAFWPLEHPLTQGPVPVVGDAVLPQSMLTTFMTARQHRLPLMAGSNSDEASVLEYFNVDTAQVMRELRSSRPLSYRLLKWLYDIHDDRLLGRAAARDLAFSVMPWLLMRAQHNVGMPGWRYWFDYVSGQSRDLYPHGAWHGNEVPYALNTLAAMQPVDSARPYTEEDYLFSQRMADYWFAFARDAGEFSYRLEGEINWPAWHPGEDLTLSFGEKGQDRLVLKRNFMRARLRLFRLMMKNMVKL
ncbi:carboxylesterase/lipase family protein [Candidatus Pantoea deserta]|uniref:Carboxylic ester hydrolase n=1 Tax=Candidatus Pantoea deserta TaxID=1869313 RepID=A0A3N4NYC8_9GAMM|nr:carboxylesterase/lipase family protein [Pantoea deserta]RPD97856.1 carboxylesterase/lipase family protein [Pantoea deserta]